MAHLTIRLIGPLWFAWGNRLVLEYAPEKARALLAFLATEKNHIHRRESLAEMLWPGRPEGAARANLRHTLRDLNNAMLDFKMHPAVLLVTRDFIQLNPEAKTWVDTAAFSSLISQGKKSGSIDIEVLEQAAELLRGKFMQGFSLKDSAEFEEWLLMKRETFTRHSLDILHQLAGFYGRKNDYPRALGYASRQLELEPCDERAHRQVMGLLAASGQRSAALAQFTACQRALKIELGVAPEEETIALYQEICSHTHDLSYPVLHNNLPAPLTPFVGRSKELTEIQHLLLGEECRLLTIMGPGGCGKTRLAIETGRNLLPFFEHGVCLVGLASELSADALLPAIGDALNLVFKPGSHPEQQVCNYVREKRLLLIMDSFEHLLVSRDLLIRLLESAPGLKILVTSRTRLEMQCEHSYRISGLEYPQGALDRLDPRQVDQFSAIILFQQAASRLSQGFTLTEANLPVIAWICRQVRGHPLSILLVANQVVNLSLGEIVSRLQKRFDHLEANWPDLPARQRSLRAVFEYSWRLLPDPLKRVFSALSVFSGSFNLAAAQQVVGAGRKDIDTLIDQSLIEMLENDCFAMHELLRQFGEEKLSETRTERQTLHDQHCDYYCSVIQTARERLKGEEQLLAIAQIRADFENILAAWDWMVERQQTQWLDQATDGLCAFFDWCGRYQEGIKACQSAMQALDDQPIGERARLVARFLGWQSLFQEKLGQLESAARSAQDSLKILNSMQGESIDTRKERAIALRQFGLVSFHTHLPAARQSAEESLVLFNETDDLWSQALVLEDLGQMASWAGQMEEARRFYEQSLTIRRKLGDRRGIAASLGALGFTLLQLGQFIEAERLAREGVENRWRLADWAGGAQELFNLGLALNWLGFFDEAQALVEEALSAYRDHLGSVETAKLLGLLATIVGLKGEYGRLRLLATESLSLANKSGSRHDAGIACWLLGGEALARGAYPESEAWMKESIQILESVGLREVLGSAHAGLGYAALGLGQMVLARVSFVEALRKNLEIRSPGAILFTLPGIALYLAKIGKLEKAVGVYAFAARQAVISNARWFDDVAGRHIESLAHSLPTDLLVFAKESFQDISLECIAQNLLEELISGIGN
jgi:DNA-binding SARP family transcriptional activator/predicted ATPase